MLRRLVYVRCLYLHGVEHAESGTQIDLALAVLNFDNTIEMLLYAVLEFLQNPDQKERHFHQLLEHVKNAIKEKRIDINVDETLNERGIRNLHIARNGVQHHGIVPGVVDVDRYRTLTEEVVTKLIRQIFDMELSDISLGMLIKDELVRNFYTEAERAFLSNDYYKALINCVAAFETAKKQEQFRLYGSGLGLRRVGISAEPNLQRFVEYIRKIDEEVEILKLRLDYKKYQKYREISRQLVPVMDVYAPRIEASSILSKIEGLIAPELKDKKQEVLREHARSRLNFDIENILKWESVPRRPWYELFLPFIKSFAGS